MTTDIKELKRLASSAELGCLSHGNKRSFAELDAFHVAAHPSAVLNLIAKIEQQQIEIDTLRHGLRLANDARSDLEAKLSAQTAEPVAWRVDGMRNDKAEVWFYWKPELPEKHKKQGDIVTPLYTHPAKTEQPSLSDAQLEEIASWLDEASDDIDSWGSYASDYFADKWDLAGAIKSYKDRAAKVRALLSAQRQDSNKDAERYRKAIAYEDNAGLLYCAVMNHCPDKAAIDAEFDAEAIDIAIDNGAPVDKG